ncbi:Pentatricopeptide repeat domain/PPR repeat [Novymonas esmeraldas]|uniref:Pentatricopeptide repeat domain/PPR repeat n=1 Tax=Novymonas esmeraldas TaxID=1808958 RepID=A0AAW0F3L6_9TRYP
MYRCSSGTLCLRWCGAAVLRHGRCSIALHSRVRCERGVLWTAHRSCAGGSAGRSPPRLSSHASSPPSASPASTGATAPVLGAASAGGAAAAVVEELNSDEVPLRTPAEVEEAFACSVQARTVSNVQLRRYIEQLPVGRYAMAMAAVKGAKAGGLRVTAPTYEVLLLALMNGGQLRASMELYQQMIQQRMTPTPNTYAALMDMCLQRNMPKACQSLFTDLQKRGVRPSARNYELMITSLAAEVPPQWTLAIEVFDKISRERKSRVTAKTYNALMLVYMNMNPFDWRIVYNCYSEMRHRRPRIPLEWESYLILEEALRKGQAGYVRRGMAYIDAWMAVTPLRSWSFAKGVLVYFAAAMVFKTLAGYVMMWYYESSIAATSDSLLSP